MNEVGGDIIAAAWVVACLVLVSVGVFLYVLKRDNNNNNPKAG